MFVNYFGFLAVQVPPTAPESADIETLLLWALGLLVTIIGLSFAFLIKQIYSYQNKIEEKDKQIESMNSKFLTELTERSEKHTELINNFTKALVDNSEKLDHLPNLLAKSLSTGFESLEKAFISHTNELMLKAIKGELNNEKSKE